MIQSALHPAGVQASRIGSLWNGYMVVLTIVYVVVILWMLAAVWRAHKSAEPQVSEVEERPHSITVGVAAAITTVTLIGLLIASIATGSAVGNYGDKRPDAITIDVTGHQWWWEVHYPSFKTANEIHIPLHQPVLLRLTTRDVIHSLWIPNLNGKRDMIPGRVNRLWIEADRPGVFRSQCAEFCGLQHAHMALVVVAEPNEKYQQWKSHQQTPANDPITPQQMHGRALFLSTCVKCHTTLAPDLTHVASRPTLAAGELLNTTGNLAGWIVNAPAIKPGTQMPPIQIASNDLMDLLAYMESLR